MEHRPYYKASEEARRECLETLLEEWETDWKDNFGKRNDGGMVYLGACGGAAKTGVAYPGCKLVNEEKAA